MFDPDDDHRLFEKLNPAHLEHPAVENYLKTVIVHHEADGAYVFKSIADEVYRLTGANPE